MSSITYYKTSKHFDSPFSEKTVSDDALDLIQTLNGLGVIVPHSDNRAVKNPRLFVCRNRAILRLDHNSYYPVKISDDFKLLLPRYPDIEVVLSSDEGSQQAVIAPVIRVLRFPEYIRGVNSFQQQNDDRKKNQNDTNETADKEKTMEVIPVDILPQAPPVEVFENWLRKNGNGEIILRRDFDGIPLAMVIYQNFLLLVSFFGASEDDWLAYEDAYEDGPPQWFSPHKHRRSPVNVLKNAFNYLKRMTPDEILPITIMSDHINIINGSDALDEWSKSDVSVCYCSRNEDFAPSFAEFLAFVSAEHPEYEITRKTVLVKLKKALGEYEEDKS